MDLIIRLPSCLWSLRIFPSLPGSRLTIFFIAMHTKDLPISPRFTPYDFFYRDANSAIVQLVNQWLNFTYSRSLAFRYGRKKTNPTLVRI